MIHSGNKRMAFNQDLGVLTYLVDFVDSHNKQNLSKDYHIVDPEFSGSVGPPTKYQELSLNSKDFSLVGQQQSILVVLVNALDSKQSVEFSFTVTFTDGGCVASPTWRSNLAGTYTYYLG